MIFLVSPPPAYFHVLGVVLADPDPLSAVGTIVCRIQPKAKGSTDETLEILALAYVV